MLVPAGTIRPGATACLTTRPWRREVAIAARQPRRRSMTRAARTLCRTTCGTWHTRVSLVEGLAAGLGALGPAGGEGGRVQSPPAAAPGSGSAGEPESVGAAAVPNAPA